MSRLSAYQRVAKSLRSEIDSGRWKTGDRLPSEEELRNLHGVSRNTVRQALSLLASSNVIQRHQGRGTFVSPQGISHVLGDLRSFTQVMRDRGLSPGIDQVTIEVDHAAPIEAKDFLRASTIWRVHRLRTGNGRAFSTMDSWVPDHIGRALGTESLERVQSLYAVLTDELGVTPHEATEVIRAESADEVDALTLDVSRGAALITVYRWTSDSRGVPVEYVRSASPGDRYEYVVKLQGAG